MASLLKSIQIPGNINEVQGPSAIQNKPVVFLQHGVLDSADAWIVNHASQTPAFVLARAGYDVWLGNSRGNKYSNSSADSKNEKEYWNYDFEDMGDYDLPAAFEYIRNVTKQEKLAYIGHSQGTSQLFYSLSNNETYFQDKISIFIALGPATRLTHESSTLLRILSSNVTRIALNNLCEEHGIYEIFPYNWLTTGAMDFICEVIPEICQAIVYLTTDQYLEEDDYERQQVYFGHFPAGTSVRSLNYYGQIRGYGEFMRYDYGKDGNILNYGQETPPIIDITKIQKVPIALFVGEDDEVATVIDNRWAKDQLKTLVYYQEYKLGHLSFLIGKDGSYFTQDVMNLLNTYHPLNLPESQQAI
ncbi:ab-hydrolase associated lipase region family protein [Stylonychia lemnae]|uniref:Ab-hydrolase associated lipase region family protein n=1 Tax=Stylonychia lemnae TaxID=5949 RepID=A0A078B9W1_STYLE|nr:ab-hydrolase associated lipase region family protein [Stylonychia lemnae]|eukprot:CDW90338.1 ab-hydrolase associated lipase region family protein [Stylonychia lemnae]